MNYIKLAIEVQQKRRHSHASYSLLLHWVSITLADSSGSLELNINIKFVSNLDFPASLPRDFLAPLKWSFVLNNIRKTARQSKSESAISLNEHIANLSRPSSKHRHWQNKAVSKTRSTVFLCQLHRYRDLWLMSFNEKHNSFSVSLKRIYSKKTRWNGKHLSGLWVCFLH